MDREGGRRRDGGPVDDRWDWPWLLRALELDRVRVALTRAMERHDLRIGDYVGWLHPDGSWTGAIESGELVRRDASGAVLGRGWDELVAALRAYDPAGWQSVHLWGSWPAADAMAAGASFAADAMVPVLLDIARLYLDVVPIDRARPR